jgi:hypothetical protein
MERITYRITLDTFKTGIQRTLRGFETADNMSRRISIGLVAGSDTYEIPLDHVTAVMYVTTPNATEPSIHDCVIEDNTIVYDMLPITTEGITEMQVKLIETSLNGARSVLVSPKFVLEVTESGVDDGGAEQTATFTALEDALARATEVYDARLLRVEIDADCTFRVFYADGTTYENEYFKEALYNGNALVAESFAIGGTGTRAGEDTDNALYYKNVAQSVFENCKAVNDDCHEVLAEVAERTVYTTFSVNFDTGHLNYLSQNYNFTVDENGRLQFESTGEYVLTDLMDTITTLENRVKALEG